MVKPLESDVWCRYGGVWYVGKDGQIVQGSYSVIKNLDSSPFADLSASAQRRQTERDIENKFLPLERRLELLKSLMTSQIESGRGCYYNCEFCSTSSLKFKKTRKSSPKRLVDEMEYMFEKYGITFYSITDNVAFDKADWWLEFVSLMKDSPITPFIQFGGYSAPRFVNKPEWIEKVIPELYFVGLRGIILGVQAGAKRVLRDIVHRPSDDPENALSFVKQVVPFGVNVKVDFIVGHPTETVEELDITHNWIKDIYNAGGEVFIRRLGVVPNSGYHSKIEQGIYTLPKESPEFNEKIAAVLGMKAKDIRYKQIAFSNGRIPNKYMADRNLGIVYPSTLFDIERLESDATRLNNSGMPDQIKCRYRKMFDLVMELKRTKRYDF